MPQVIFSPKALHDLERLREFLRPKNPVAAERAAQTIIKSLRTLASQPHAGRPINDLPAAFRDWPIDFGDSGYIARYRMDNDTIVILALRHQKEAGY
jgi:plasmid stabilization system protein ParE